MSNPRESVELGGPRWSRAGRELGPFVALALAWALFAVLAGANFRSLENQRLILIQTMVVGTAAIGATLVIVSKGLDLSVGSLIALGTVVCARAMEAGAGPATAALVTIACAAAVGGVIGSAVVGRLGPVVGIVGGLVLGVWMTRKFGAAAGIASGAALAAGGWFGVSRAMKPLPLSPFIVTLGMWGALRGAAKGLADNTPVYAPSGVEQTWLGSLTDARANVLGVPAGVWVFLALAALMALVMATTVLGRHVYAVGSNEATARLCGVRVDRVKVLVYVLGAACAGVAGLMQFSYLGGMGDPTTAGGLELQVIAAVVIGGASLSGGEGTIRGTILGALLMTVVENGCTKLGLDNWVQEIITGGIIVAAVVVDRARHRGSSG